MTQAALIRCLVLNEICDDFENVDQIILLRLVEGKLRPRLAAAGSLESIGSPTT